jgi:putative transposase
VNFESERGTPNEDLTKTRLYVPLFLWYYIFSSQVDKDGYYMNLDNNNHSVFSLYYHLVLVIKYRRKVIDDDISKRLQEMYESIGANYHILLQEWNHDRDHIHVLFKAHPNSELSKFINAYKSASSRIIKKDFPIIRKSLWKECFWSKSYCLLTTGGVPIDIVKKYIETQRERN